MKRRHEPRHNKIVHKNYSTQSVLLTYSTWFKAWSNKYTHITQDYYDNNNINSTSLHLQHTFAMLPWHSAHCTSQITQIWTCNSWYKSSISETASRYPWCATAQMRRRILKGQCQYRHEPKAIFVTVKQNNDIDGYTIRMRRSVLSLRSATHKYTILNRVNFVDTSYLHSIFRL